MAEQKTSTKTFGARILCSVCSAQPWPSDPAVRETFSLLRLGPNGRPADSPAPGEWRCEAHPIAEQDLPAKRAPRVAPVEALTSFGNVIEVEIARLGEEVAHGDRLDAEEALAAFQKEIERGFDSLRKAVQP
jgi:hypothetical protein